MGMSEASYCEADQFITTPNLFVNQFGSFFAPIGRTFDQYTSYRAIFVTLTPEQMRKLPPLHSRQEGQLVGPKLRDAQRACLIRRYHHRLTHKLEAVTNEKNKGTHPIFDSNRYLDRYIADLSLHPTGTVTGHKFLDFVHGHAIKITQN